jgi:CRP-like cAMP-binding protein
MYDTLMNAIKSIAPVSDLLESRLFEYLQVKEFKKKSHLLRDGQTANYIYFIEQGLVKSFYIKDGKEVNSWFMKENDFIVAVNSFFTRTASYEFIEAIEDTTVYLLSYNHLQSLYKEFIEFNKIGRIVTEKYYVLSEQRQFALRKQKAEERLAIFLETQPELAQRISRTDIASYLGISLETLSRISLRKPKKAVL